MATKTTAKTNGSFEMTGMPVTVRTVFPHLDPIEGTLHDMNQYGAVTEAEYRGYKYLSLTPWQAIRTLEARIKIEESKSNGKVATTKGAEK
jgi:hypothetical protein